MKRTFIILWLLGTGLLSCKETKHSNNNVVIVDIGNFDREGIAKEIRIIDSLAPRLIVIDVMFVKEKSLVQDSLLADALNKCDNVIMMSSIEGFDNGTHNEYDSLTTSLTSFTRNAKTGFTNAILDDSSRTLTKFCVSKRVNGRIEYHLAIKAAMMFDSLKTINFIRNNPEIVPVDYCGNLESFKVLSTNDILHRQLKSVDFRDKIVLLGSLRTQDRDIFETTYTMKNNSSPPFMFGVIIVANIISQALK